MEIALKPEHERLIMEWVAEGRFCSTEDAVTAALELVRIGYRESLDDEPLPDAVKELLRVGAEELDRGEYLEYQVGEGDRFVEDVRKRSEARRAKSREVPAR